MAPKASQTSRDDTAGLLEEHELAGARRPAAAPKASPPQNAATNPLPSIRAPA